MSEAGPSYAFIFSSPKTKRAKRSAMNCSEKQFVVNVFKHMEETWPKDSYPYKDDIVEKTATTLGISNRSVYRFLQEEKASDHVKSPPRSPKPQSHESSDEIVQKTATPLGTSKASVYRILQEKKATDRVKSPPPRSLKPRLLESTDDFVLGAIRQKVHSFYFNNKLPTIGKVLETVNSDDTLPNMKRTTLCNILKKIQFTYVKRSRKIRKSRRLIEREDIVLWRVKYLNTIRKLRIEGKKIYYLDETSFNEGHTMNKVCHNKIIQPSKEAHHEGLSIGAKSSSGKGKRFIILHIGSDTGFVQGGELIFEVKESSGEYHSEMDAYNFEKWFNQILPMLDSNSVIVMDNAPYHSRRKEKIPTFINKKCELQAWLRDKNIPFEETEVRAELLEKINREKEKYQAYVIDEMAQEKGFTVVRLPPYHCELNPIELIWHQVKGYVAKKNKTFKLNEVKSLLADRLQIVTAETWQKCIQHVIQEEEKMLKIDGIIDHLVDQFMTGVGDNSDSDTAGSSDTDTVEEF